MKGHETEGRKRTEQKRKGKEKGRGKKKPGRQGVMLSFNCAGCLPVSAGQDSSEGGAGVNDSLNR